jgi:hypothetical protein
MSKSKEKLSPQEWQARHDAACAIVARKYCDMYAFWRTVDTSRAAAPGDAAGIKASAWRAAGTAFLTKPALLRKFGRPKRHPTPTASPARPTTIRPVRFASITRKSQAPRRD